LVTISFVGAIAISGDISKMEEFMKFKALCMGVVALAGLTMTSASAHHSFAMFDAEKNVKLDGTVKEFQWTNPHSWILMMVKNAQGVEEQWAIEMGGPAGLARQGWIPKTLTPGMKVTAIIHPLKDGTRGGQFMAVTLPDGTLKGNPNAAASANAGGN
jgi:hypothetical protein